MTKTPKARKPKTPAVTPPDRKRARRGVYDTRVMVAAGDEDPPRGKRLESKRTSPISGEVARKGESR